MLLAISQAAQAHGEEILVSFYAQAIAVVACFAGLQFLPVARPHRIVGVIACLAGVVFAEIAVSNVPYSDNRIAITIAMVIIPILATFASVFLGRANAKRKQRT
jgi:phosphate/sulfate permease